MRSGREKAEAWCEGGRLLFLRTLPSARAPPSLNPPPLPPPRRPPPTYTALPPVEPAAGARPPRPLRTLDSRAARQAAARAGVPPSPQFGSGRGGGGPAQRRGRGPADPTGDAVRAQERVALDVWSDARFAAAGGAVVGAMLLVFLAKADF